MARTIHVHLHDALSPEQARLAASYEDLALRMWLAAREVDARTADSADWSEQKHPRAPDGRFGHVAGEHEADGPLPAKSGMHAVHALLSTGRPFTREELLAATGLKDKKLTDYLAMLKNPKYAKPGVLNISKLPDGRFQVVLPSGQPAPPNPGPPPAPPAPPKPPPAPVTVTAPPAPDIKPYAGTPAAAAQELREFALKNGIQLDVQHTESGRIVAARKVGTFAGERDYNWRLMRDYGVRMGLAHEPPKYPSHEHVLTFQIPVPQAAPKRALPASWEPAKTAKEVTQRAVSEGWVDEADFGRMSPEAANQYMTSLAEHLHEFPALRTENQFFVGTNGGYKKNRVAKQTERTVAALLARKPDATPDEIAQHVRWFVRPPKFSSKAWAYAWRWPNTNERAVTFNETYSTDVEAARKTMQRGVNDGFHSPGCTDYRSTMDHELGHQLDYLLDLRKHPEIVSMYAETMHAGVRNKGVIPHEVAVSKYGRTNAAEFIAECWAEAKNSPQPRPRAQRVAEIIRSEYARKYGRT